MNTADLLRLRFERTQAALAHEHEMRLKYKDKDDCDNYNCWWVEHELERTDGTKYIQYYHDFPKPYSTLYFRRFLQLILECQPSDIRWNLDEEFVGDKVDMEYVESLLLEAEEWSLDVEGAILIAGGDGANILYLPGKEGRLTVADNSVASSDVFQGGIKFIRRAEVVRSWLNERKQALSAAEAGPFIAKGFEWDGQAIEFAQVVYGLMEAGFIKKDNSTTRENVAKQLADFLSLSLPNPSKTYADVTKLEKTEALEKMISALKKDYIRKDKDKQAKK